MHRGEERIEGHPGAVSVTQDDQALDIDVLKELSPGKLVTPDRRRRTVMVLQERFGVSERRACRVVGQSRSTQRLPAPTPSDYELALRAFLRDFSRSRPRWGWRRAARAARDAGWAVNAKRIHRLWREESLRVSLSQAQASALRPDFGGSNVKVLLTRSR